MHRSPPFQANDHKMYVFLIPLPCRQRRTMIAISEGLQESHRYHTTHTRETNHHHHRHWNVKKTPHIVPICELTVKARNVPFSSSSLVLLSSKAATPTSKEPDFLATIYLSVLSCVQVRFLPVGRSGGVAASKSPEKCVICSTLRANSRFCSFARLIILDSYG